MTLRDTLDRVMHGRIATRYSNPKYSKKQREEMEKKYNKRKKFHQAPKRMTTFGHIAKYVNQKNINTIFDTVDSITRAMPQPKTNQPRLNNPPKNVPQGIFREDNSNEMFGYEMFNPKKKKDFDFFRL